MQTQVMVSPDKQKYFEEKTGMTVTYFFCDMFVKFVKQIAKERPNLKMNLFQTTLIQKLKL